MEKNRILGSLIVVMALSRALGKVMVTQMSPNLIDTQFGKIRGVLVTLQNPKLGPVEMYLGLQYATLLGGELRFMPPTSSMEKWDGIRVTLRYRPVCPQKIPDLEEMKRKMPMARIEHFKRIIPFLEHQSEDCLNLNLYVPVRDSSTDADHQVHGLFPVVVFVHGESFEFGTGNAYDGSVLASYGRVIVITLNYRLGVLGFLSTGDGNSPGNYAILDLVAALHWIKENIGSFGGDPDSVTLMGHGHGGTLVNLLMVSPVAKGRNLFQKVIIQSGVALSSWAMIPDPWPYTLRLSALVNCTSPLGPPPSAPNIMRCLKHVPVEALNEAALLTPKYFSSLGPTVDYRSVLPFSLPRLMLRPTNSMFGNVKLLIGLTANEGLQYFNQTLLDRGITEAQRTRMLRTFVHNVYQYNKQYIYDVLDHQYRDWERSADSRTLRDNLMELLGDGLQVAPILEVARLHARLNSATYLYVFNYTSSESRGKIGGAAYGDELMYVFGAPLTDGVDPFPSVYSNTDRLVSESVLNQWINFIRHGDPNQPELSGVNKGQTGSSKDQTISNSYWPLYELSSQQVKCINDPRSPSRIIHHYRGSKVALWLELIPRLHKADSLESRYHLLDDSFNSSTFESEGTRPVLLDDVSPKRNEPTELSEPTSTRLPKSATNSLSEASDTENSSDGNSKLGNSTVKTGDRQRGVDKGGHNISARNRGPTAALTHNSGVEIAQKSEGLSNTEVVGSNTPEAASRKHEDSEKGIESGYLTLTLTVSVGCALLILNVAVFAAVFLQRSRVRKERRLVKLEAQRQQELRDGVFNKDDRRALNINHVNHVTWADDGKSDSFGSPFREDSTEGIVDQQQDCMAFENERTGLKVQYSTVPRGRAIGNHRDTATREHLDNGKAVKYLPLDSPSSENRTSTCSYNPSTVV